MAGYRPRLIEKNISEELEAFGAILIEGPKWCGKTTTASLFAKSIVRMQDPDERDKYKAIVDTAPSRLLKGDKPRLIDEWQTAPKLWDAIRLDVDLSGKKGSYILTGSKTIESEEIEHSGTGRIDMMTMSTMTLFESGDSTGEVSLIGMFRGSIVDGGSDKSLEDVAGLLIRGGWPESIGMSSRTAHLMMKRYCNSILETEINDEGGKHRDPNRMKMVLRSISRNISAPLSKQTIIRDISSGNAGMSENTLNDYLESLRRIHVLEELPSWNPNLRSKAAIRTSPTVQLCDPAIAAFFLSADENDLIMDPNTFGLLFESLVIRDLRVYARYHGGEVFHYRDSNNLEVDAIIHLDDGRWGAVEVKLAHTWVDEAAKNLLKLRKKVDTDVMNEPSFLAVVIPTGYAYTRDDGVHVVPITCLRE